MRIPATLILFTATLLLAGCPKNAPKLDLSSEATKKTAMVQMRENVFPDEVFQYECWKSGSKKIVFSSDDLMEDERKVKGNTSIEVKNGKYTYFYKCVDLTTSDTVNGESKAREVRNQIFQKGHGIIDEVYFKYSTAIRTNRSRDDFIMDLIDVGLGTAIGLTKGKASTIRDLGIILVGYRSGRDSARLRLYDDQTTEIILDAMDAARSEVLLNFRNNDGKKSISEYSMEAAFADLYKYYAVGSQTEAFKRIRRKTAASAERAENAVLNITEPINIYAPTEESVTASLSYGAVVKAFKKEIADADNDPSKIEDRFKDVNSKLVAIFQELTKGDLSTKFKPYIDAVYKKSTDSFKAEQIGTDFSKDIPLTKQVLSERLTLLDEIRQELSVNDELGKAEDLKTRMNQLFNQHGQK